MKRKENLSENYLEKIPVRSSYIYWKENDSKVTLEIKNEGFFNRIAQIFFGRPEKSYVHLDSMGSFVWPIIDGEKDIIAIGKIVKEKFGEECEPLYERLAKFFQILESYNFIYFR